MRGRVCARVVCLCVRVRACMCCVSLCVCPCVRACVRASERASERASSCACACERAPVRVRAFNIQRWGNQIILLLLCNSYILMNETGGTKPLRTVSPNIAHIHVTNISGL